MDYTEPKLYFISIHVVVKYTKGFFKKKEVEIEIDQLLSMKVFSGIAPLEIIIRGANLPDFKEWDLDKDMKKAYGIHGDYEIVAKKIVPLEREFSIEYLRNNMDAKEYLKFVRDYEDWLDGDQIKNG